MFYHDRVIFMDTFRQEKGEGEKEMDFMLGSVIHSRKAACAKLNDYYYH